MELVSRSALVTGAPGGVCRAIVKALVDGRAAVLSVDRDERSIDVSEAQVWHFADGVASEAWVACTLPATATSGRADGPVAASNPHAQRTRPPGDPLPIILDCDPGHDDALAILLALARPELELLALTTVAGNAPLEATTRNALSVLTLADRADIPVAAGADRPLELPLSTAAEVHGSSGLEGAQLPQPQAEARAEGALELTAAIIEASDRPITLLATGPLTNIAILVRERPDLLDRIGGICLMGGAIGAGNWTASAEFNIWVDPHAAAIVFDSGSPITMIGIDVTHQAVIPVSESDTWAASGNRTGRLFADLFRYFAIFHRDRYGWDGSPAHDAMAVAHLAVPGLVETRRYRVDVETVSEFTRGRTVVDTDGLSGLAPNADVGVAVDSQRFRDMIGVALATFP